ncbi:MAG: hypothetical protein UT32_C0025G0015 [Parcubacteria group bacterium GW2011_GWC2_39_14]|nr:MAG: hypothetical protein UT32_C0025G0015 [Parcubacteria group bacterium GW2011_GWC2_39_14]
MDLKPDFLGKQQNKPRKKLYFFLKFFFGFIAIGALLAFATSSGTISEDGFLQQVPFVRRVNQLIHSGDRMLSGSKDNRTNILLLGMGGVKHEGPYLTDTIMIASIKQSTGEVALISIPRDLAVPIPGHSWAKVNGANAYGEQKDPGNGAELTRDILEDVLDQKIDYYVRVDFEGFKTLIDELGGINIYVERDFVDNTYPTGENGEVTTLEFKKGWENMNSERALEFARSRHGNNGEGSDFARAARQQKILMAVRKKIFSLGILKSPSKISAIAESLDKNISTDLSAWEMLALGKMVLSLKVDDIKPLVLDDSPQGLLTSTFGVDGAYLLIPKQNDWSKIRSAIDNIFEQSTEETPQTASAPKDPLRIEIQNGTEIAGLAAQAADLIEREGYTVTKIGNATERGRTRTVIYDLTDGRYANELRALRTLLDADVSLTVPGWLLSPEIVPQELRLSEIPEAKAAQQADFLIILGKSEQ